MATRPLRSLVLTSKPVFPLIGGAPIRNWQTINSLKTLGPVATFAVASSTSEWGDAPPGVALWRNHQTGGLPPTRKRKIAQRLWWVRPHGHKGADRFFHESIERDLEKVMEEFQPDLIVLEELWVHAYVDVIARSGRPWIYDTHNVEALLKRNRHAPARSLKARLTANLMVRRVKSIEKALVRGAGQVWVCSREEVEPLRRLYGHDLPIRVIPNTVDVAHYRSDTAGTEPEGHRNGGPPTLICTATFAYRPNALAAGFLIEEIFPRVLKDHPDCRLLLVGDQPTPQMLEAARRDPAITVTGRVPEVRPHLSAADVVVVPLTEGGGTRLKILEAFAAGCAVVSTSKGAEGLEVTDGTHLLIRDDWEAFAQGVGLLLSRPDLRAGLARQAGCLVRSSYSLESLTPMVREAVHDLLEVPCETI